MRNKVVIVLLAAGMFFSRTAFGVVQLIGDGNFQSSTPLNFWSEVGDTAGVNFVSGNPGFVDMGGVSGVNNQIVSMSVYQTTTNIVPTNTILLQASYSWGFSSTDTVSSVELSSFVENLSATQVTNLDNKADGGANVSNQHVTTNLTGFAGQKVDFVFQVQAFQAGLGAATVFGVSDVSLLAFTTDDIPTNDYFTNAIDLNGAAGISVTATNVVATKEPGEPKIANNNGGHSVWWKWTAPASGIVNLTTKGSTFNTLLGVFTGPDVSNLTQVAADNSGSNSVVKFPVAAGTTYDIAIDGKNGATGIAQLNLTFTLDTTPPKVAISSPASGAKLTNSTILVKGTASDNVAVMLVQYRLENANGTNNYQDADGTNTWTANVTDLIPGLNTIRVRAFDTSSNVSAAVTRTVTYIVVSPFTLTTNGSGTVSPKLNNTLLNVGQKYTLTCKPGSGQVFSNCVDSDDDVIATTPTFTFTMTSNLDLTVNFVPNPFIPFTGVYDGLFYDTNGAEHQSSGFYNLTLASSGSFSAKVIIAGKSYSYTGRFAADGSASNNIVRKGMTTVAAALQLDLQAGTLSGHLGDGTWLAELNADRAMTNAAAEAGHYTVAIPGSGDDSNSAALPGGDSYGTVLVSANGALTFAGALADGTKVSQKALLLANGQWPFYVPLYSGNGSIFGWLTFSNQPGSDITGTVSWFKLAQPAAKFYPAGFTNITAAAGSAYHFSVATPVLNPGDGLIWFANGNLANSFTNQVTLAPDNKVTNNSPNALTLTLTTSTGLFKVTVVNPATGKSVTGNGVILQKQNSASGFFLGTNQVGLVFWAPAGT